MLFLILLPSVAGFINFTGGDDLPDDYYLQAGGFTMAWAKMQGHQMLLGLRIGMSVFALFGVYRGGRSDHRRFNDRTIASINLFRGIFSVTALLRAVFVSFRLAPANSYE